MQEFFNQITAMAALAVMAVQQLLKLKFIPVSFANRYPVPTLIGLSVAASLIATYYTKLNPNTVWEWIGTVAVVATLAAVVYNNTLRNWNELRDMEGEK